MPEDIGFIAFRYIAGYLLQVVPCAILCFLPFKTMLRYSTRRIGMVIGVCIVLACGLFTFAGIGPLEPFENQRYFLTDLVFMALLVVLLAVYAQSIEASLSKKAFVFLFVMTYGCVVSLLQYAISLPLGILYLGDTWMYYPPKLLLSAILNVVLFPFAWLLMKRVIAPQLTTTLNDSRWWRLCSIPIVILIVLVGFYWLPIQLNVPYNVVNVLLGVAAIIGVLLVLAINLRTTRDMGNILTERDELAECVDSLSEHINSLKRERNVQEKRSTLAESLSDNAENGDCSHEKATTASGSSSAVASRSSSAVALDSPSTAVFSPSSTVTFKTSSAVATFKIKDLSFLEVFGHRLVIHLTTGKTEELNFSLSQARALLPEEIFIQCHRSFLVNKQEIQLLRRYEIVLNDGSVIPVSKQRYRDVEAALG